MTTVNHRNPVLLVHGIWDTGKVFRKLSAHLTELGWSVHALNLSPNNSSVGLDKLAKQVAAFAEERFGPHGNFDLVGFSMGGLVSRYYVQRLGGGDRVQRFVTISSPHHGTLMAYALPLEGTVQMRPQSQFLEDLNADATKTLGKLNFTSIWTKYDAMIVPGSSSEMPVGKNIHLPVLIHRWMVSDRRCFQVITQALSEPIKADATITR
ncbi:MAG TPA: triacylglycerol lipase [Oscillatoriaceae cyanobacterium M33_DOE_052]|uniref:Triacylglycerol lipase n=1 Tax=Planktothricoides sp. SpSt-374 TaxID=2282167 RepID=A0A7C3ZQP8_9CYAN|nr:triacylglycerol lipase [Oscillatoriaceae cyanobacterium M33_DOE_052]